MKRTDPSNGKKYTLNQYIDENLGGLPDVGLLTEQWYKFPATSKSDIIAIQEIVAANGDVMMCTTVTDIQKVKKGGLVTVGVTPEVFEKIANGTEIFSNDYIIALIIVNGKQFKAASTGPQTLFTVEEIEEFGLWLNKLPAHELVSVHPYKGDGMPGPRSLHMDELVEKWVKQSTKTNQ